MIQWDESLLTGHTEVDSDHCHLVSMINDLERSLHSHTAVESLAATLHELRVYASEHFSREESHMLVVSCPAFARNRAEHERFAARIDGWVTRLELEGPSTSLAFDVYHDTGNWLSSHIRGTDCELRDCPHDRR